MKPLFADSSYYIALMSARDAWHAAAVPWNEDPRQPLVTTEFVLVEVANAFCSPKWRNAFGILLSGLRSDPGNLVLPATTELFGAGVALYLRRLDKQWSLTDCISFVVMERRGLGEALTADRHFEQAGFTALLRQGHDG